VSRVTATILALAALGLAGCSDDHRVIGPRPPSVPSLSLSQLLSAPDSLVVDSTTMSVHVDLWRDFMSDHTSGSPLFVSAQLNGSPPGTYPASAGEVYVWVIHESNVWSAIMPLTLIDPNLSGAHVYQVGGGPRWGPGITVDVVLGVRTSPTEVSLVRLRDVLILMTL
jgi:hypothetical protein